MLHAVIACEYSGVVRDSFSRRGWDAISVDLLPTEAPGNHYQGDIFELLDSVRGYDLLIGHPPCTFLTNSAEWLYKDRQSKKLKPGTLYGAARRQARAAAIDFASRLYDCDIKHVAIENPAGALSRWRPASQYIQPYQHGHDASKKTGLWLKNLPLLRETCFVEPRWVKRDFGEPLPRWGNQTDSGQNREPPTADRGKIRSRFWEGVAAAMADQWGGYLEKLYT